MNNIHKNLDKQKEKECVKTVEEWLINSGNSDFNLSQHCEIYKIKEKEKKDVYKYFELMRSIIDEEMKVKEKDNSINKMEDFEQVKNSFREQKIFYRIYDQKRNLWIEPTYRQTTKKKSNGFFTKIKTAMNAFIEIMSSNDVVEYTTLDEAKEHRKYYMSLIHYGNDLVRFGAKEVDIADHYIEVLSKIENRKIEDQKEDKRILVENVENGNVETEDEIVESIDILHTNRNKVIDIENSSIWSKKKNRR